MIRSDPYSYLTFIGMPDHTDHFWIVSMGREEKAMIKIGTRAQKLQHTSRSRQKKGKCFNFKLEDGNQLGNTHSDVLVVVFLFIQNFLLSRSQPSCIDLYLNFKQKWCPFHDKSTILQQRACAKS